MLSIIKFEKKYEEDWDNFILNKSINGCFLQSRRFLNYHPKGRFNDNSLIVLEKGNIVALIPGCKIGSEFISHKGSTFGGIILNKKSYNSESLEEIIICFDEYLIQNKFKKSILKITSDLFSKESNSLLQYMLFKNKYYEYKELSSYVDVSNVKDPLNIFSQKQRNSVRSSLKQGMIFFEIKEYNEIETFYNILELNLKKFDKEPVHSLKEIIDLYDRLRGIILFFGVKKDTKIISGTMIFKYNNIIHTQYLASLERYRDLKPMPFLFYKIIEYASENKEISLVSWGISTEDKGKYLNKGLIKFKESFGSKYIINSTFEKVFNGKVD